MRPLKKIFCLASIFLIIYTCERGQNDIPPKINNTGKVTLSGYVQKGPFINGSVITAFELNNNMVQTGKSFSAQITDNSGAFEFKDIELSSKYVKLQANGFYYNEVTDEESTAPLTLSAIADLEDTFSVNVNILTHLEKERIDVLMEKNMDFASAKSEALNNILKIFSINNSDIKAAESLDISKPDDDNAILLAISIILQGFRSEAALTELLSNISADIRDDGVLNNDSLGSELINNIKQVDLNNVRQNLEGRYASLGIKTTISDFEKYIKLFTDSTNYIETAIITYPNAGKYGLNLLNENDSVFENESYFSLCANLPPGNSLMIKHNGNKGQLGYPVGQENTGWDDLGPGATGVWRTYQSNRTGYIDMKVIFMDNVTLYIYENGSEKPTRIKNLYNPNHVVEDTIRWRLLKSDDLLGCMLSNNAGLKKDPFIIRNENDLRKNFTSDICNDYLPFVHFPDSIVIGYKTAYGSSGIKNQHSFNKVDHGAYAYTITVYIKDTTVLHTELNWITLPNVITDSVRFRIKKVFK